MYQIVASDLDGTLLSPEHVLSVHTKDTLRKLTSQGIHFVFATGRHHIDVAHIRSNLGIRGYMITSNGARVHNEQDELIFSHNVAEDIAGELYKVVYDCVDIQTHVYRNDDWFTNRPCEEDIEAFFQDSGFDYSLYDPNTLATDGVCKVFFTCDDHQLLLPLEQQIKTRWGDRVNVSFSTVTCLEVMAGEVSKGHALDEVAKLLGYSLADCIAFGDGMNDVEMLSMAGKGCIMVNAHQRLKDTLPNLEVIGSNADDAVANYLLSIYNE